MEKMSTIANHQGNAQSYNEIPPSHYYQQIKLMITDLEKFKDVKGPEQLHKPHHSSKPGLEFKHTASLSLILSLSLSPAFPFEARYKTNRGFDQCFAFHLELLFSDII